MAKIWARRDELKPTDLLTPLSLLIAVGAFALSLDTQRSQQQIEERQSAPVLVGVFGYSVEDAGGRQPPLTIERDELPRLVIPLWNAGAGPAFLLGAPPAFIEFGRKKCGEVWKLGGRETLSSFHAAYYVVASGKSQALAFRARKKQQVTNGSLSRIPNDRRKPVDDSFRGGTEAQAFKSAAQADEFTVAIRYTDALGRKLRWTCVTYKRGNRSKQRTAFHVASQVYGEHDL